LASDPGFTDNETNSGGLAATSFAGREPAHEPTAQMPQFPARQRRFDRNGRRFYVAEI